MSNPISFLNFSHFCEVIGAMQGLGGPIQFPSMIEDSESSWSPPTTADLRYEPDSGNIAGPFRFFTMDGRAVFPIPASGFKRDYDLLWKPAFVGGENTFSPEVPKETLQQERPAAIPDIFYEGVSVEFSTEDFLGRNPDVEHQLALFGAVSISVFLRNISNWIHRRLQREQEAILTWWRPARGKTDV